MISAVPVSGGAAEIALNLTTASGQVFLKGARGERAGIERRVQKFLPARAPKMLWHTDVDSWLILAFEYISGRNAVLTPGSPDLGLVADAVRDISGVRCPELPVLPAEKRWAPYATAERLNYLRGDSLVHTDPTAENFIVTDGGVRVVDWGWPSLGAPWLDTATLVVRLIQSGHDPWQAEDWAADVSAWRAAPRAGIRVYAEVRAVVAARNSAPICSSWHTYLAWLNTV
ncbi:hypothetical protein [Actinokineospora sp.]|uniref:hypothetical protein n=1 Tax=Actinokineospora sp. TaxID=1872133 RepID=UPI00403843A8